MRTRIGATRRVDLVVGARDLTQRPLQLGFDGAAVCLLLPAGKTASVVLQHDFHIHLLTVLSGISREPTLVDELDDHHRG